jgi:hypothetical protein
VDECIDEYLAISQKAFQVDKFRKRKFSNAYRAGELAQFDHDILESELRRLVEKRLNDKDARMAESSRASETCPTFVVAVSIREDGFPPTIFRSYDGQGHQASKCAIWQAARATSASPTFFQPIIIDVPEPGAMFVDGYNNPSELTITEAQLLWSPETPPCLVSIGTGQQRHVTLLNSNKSHSTVVQDDGNVEPSDLEPIVHPFQRFRNRLNKSDAPRNLIGLRPVDMAERVHQGLLSRSFTLNDFRYFRFNIQQGLDADRLADWENMDKLSPIAARYLTEGEQKIRLELCVELLMSSRVVRSNTPLDLPLTACKKFLKA